MLVKKIYVYAEETEYNNLKQWFDLIEIVRVDKETLSNIEMRSLLIIFCKGLNLDFFNEVEKSISKSQKYIFFFITPTFPKVKKNKRCCLTTT